MDEKEELENRLPYRGGRKTDTEILENKYHYSAKKLAYFGKFVYLCI